MARSQPQVSNPTSLQAPTGGWNARDSIAAMPVSDAVILENFFPSTTDVELRFGYSENATGITGQVETLIVYNGANTEELFAINADRVYDVSAAGAVGAAVLSGLTNGRWQYINVSTTGGNFIEMCNGADSVHTYNGTSWVDQSAAITGVTSSNLININMHKNRVWFIEKNTLDAWYLPTASISGAAKALALAAYCPHGGFLMAMGTWTIDAGYGIDDLAVFITSQGDVIVFRGTDPASATTWALVGQWYLGAPIGRRCFVKYAGDLLLINRDGVMPMSAALQSSRTNPAVALTDKIKEEMARAIQTNGANFGWELINFPTENMLILNVPVNTGSEQEQYVMNTITGAWCKFKGWNANCFALYKNNQLRFGTNTVVAKAWDTNKDNATAIAGEGLQAFSYFESPGQVKQFKMMRPTFLLNGPITIKGNVNVDFDITVPAATLANAPFTGSTWDDGVWDTGIWADTLELSSVWQGVAGVGRAGATRLSVSGDGFQFKWLATDIIMEPGGVL